ncbi:BTAD domain-containing putative transcriptional regulator [Lysinibacillus endophyticus]|uniref:BTAD domain-containing putative transcriptional regulator n=1 Tax=Ureibacillus endophyticus TaxID=1978490 RepID=UPI0031365CD3
MNHVLLSKLIPPDPSIHYLHRSRLLKKLSKSAHVKLTVVHSGAGFGKTSALAQLMTNQNQRFSWYQVTEDDDDILPFLRHLFYSIQRVNPSFGKEIEEWDHFSSFPKVEDLNKLYRTFINEFCKTEEPLFVIIDDFHLVNHVFQINYIMDKIIEHLPPHIHFIVASRIYPNWKCILPLRMNANLVECKEEDFVFSAEEVEILFEDFFDRKLSKEEVNNILTLTEGWPIVILLLAMQSTESTLPIQEIAKVSLQDFFSYLSEEVFENLNAGQQEALLKYSIFQTFSLQLIETFYNKEMATQLKELVKYHAFIQPLVGFQEFRFHALFKQFLEVKFQEKDYEQWTELQKQATNYFSHQKDPVNALYHAFKSNDEELIANTLMSFATTFIRAGQFDYFLERVKELGEDTRKHFYPLYFFEGECQRYRAQYEKAKKAYEKCMKFATEQQDRFYILKANAGIAHIYLDTIQPAFAQKYLMNALHLVDTVEMDAEELHLLQRQYAENLVNLGRAGEAEEWVLSKGLPQQVLAQGNLDVRILLRQGKLAQARKLIQQRENEHNYSLDAHRESDVLHALILSLLGENEEALRCSINTIHNSLQDYSQFSLAVAYLRKGHATWVLNPLLLEEAETCYLKAIEVMDEIHVSRAKAESYLGLAIVKIKQGVLHEALSFVKLGLYETEKAQDQWVTALLLTASTIIHLENNNLGEAKKCAEKAKELFEISPDYYGMMVTNFWLSYIAYKNGDTQEFMQCFESFASLCSEHNFYFFLNKRTLFGPERFLSFWETVSYALQTKPNDQNIQQIAQFLQLHPDSLIPKHTFALRVLGPFTMKRDGLEIVDKEWKREKAKELFLYLYFHRNRFVAKEEIMHALWPNSDEQSMNRDFKVAYNACLKVLQPDRLARDDSPYILRKQSMYKLHPVIAFSSDMEFFEKFAKLGLNEKNTHFALELLLKAYSMYKGPVLEDLSSFQWVEGKRAEIHKLIILVNEKIAQIYAELEDYQSTIEWAEKLLQLDSTWEEGYRLLMLAYYHQNNRPQAVRWYEKCVEVLEEELNIEPMETTIQVYEMISR